MQSPERHLPALKGHSREPCLRSGAFRLAVGSLWDENREGNGLPAANRYTTRLNQSDLYQRSDGLQNLYSSV